MPNYSFVICFYLEFQFFYNLKKLVVSKEKVIKCMLDYKRGKMLGFDSIGVQPKKWYWVRPR